MAKKEPMAEPMLSTAEATTLPWADALQLWAAGSTNWLATVRPDGRPHVVPIGAAWADGTLYFTTGQGTRKGENLAHNAHCALSVAARGFDLVLEGTAAQVHDDATLQRLAAVYVAGGWPATVRAGALDAPFSAPTTGPAPYDVYEVTPTVAFAFATEEATINQMTRYRF